MAFGLPEEPRKKSFSNIAHMTTLSPEEQATLEEEEQTASETEEVSADSEYTPGEGYVRDEAAAEEQSDRLEHTEPMYRLASRPDTESMYEFMLYHSYSNVAGILSLIIGFGAIGLFVYEIVIGAPWIQILLFGMVVLMFLSNCPPFLMRKAKKQAEALSADDNVITYSFSDAGLDLQRGKEYAPHAWEDVYKVKEGKTGFFIYLAKNRAFLVPKKDLGLGHVDDFRDMIDRHVTNKKLLTK